MAKREGFRAAFRGFHRQDVMDYMDHMQADFSEREAGLREGLSNANASLHALTEENAAMKAAVATAEQKAESLRAEAFDRFEQMNAQLLMLKKENERLRDAAARADSRVAKNTAALSDNRDELLFALYELRARGTEFLETSGKAGEACLDEMDGLLSALEQKLAQMRSEVGAARADLNARQSAAGLRLNELEAAIKGEAPLPQTAYVPATNAPVAKSVATPAAPDASAAKSAPDASAAKSAPAETPTAAPAAGATRLVSSPTRSREGWRRLLDGLLGF